jgi:hypothetical protein
MVRLLHLLIALAIGGGMSRAEPNGAASGDPNRRIVLADPDPELLRAVSTTLAPYELEIVVDDTTPATTTEADARAEHHRARFVVWRRGGDLVVFDRRRGAAEHREGPTGELDPPSASAAALTVKTLMRLSRDGEVTAGGLELRLQTQLLARLAADDLGGRLAGAVLIRPTGSWRIGLAGDLGTGTTVQASGFKGTWTDWSLLAIASWPQPLGEAIELEPHVAAGFARSALSGIENMVVREERELLATLRVGGSLRRRFGVWTVGPVVELTALLGTPSYPKRQGTGDLFAVPGFGFSIGGLAAIDFGGAKRL